MSSVATRDISENDSSASIFFRDMVPSPFLSRMKKSSRVHPYFIGQDALPVSGTKFIKQF